jgi:hypothetical protein
VTKVVEKVVEKGVSEEKLKELQEAAARKIK